MKNILFRAKDFSMALRMKMAEDNIDSLKFSEQTGIDMIELKAMESGSEEFVSLVPFKSILLALDYINKEPDTFIAKYANKGDGFILK